jgi:hypothetical protein
LGAIEDWMTASTRSVDPSKGCMTASSHRSDGLTGRMPWFFGPFDAAESGTPASSAPRDRDLGCFGEPKGRMTTPFPPLTRPIAPGSASFHCTNASTARMTAGLRRPGASFRYVDAPLRGTTAPFRRLDAS